MITKFEIIIQQPNKEEALNIATEANNIGIKEPIFAKLFDLPNRFTKYGIQI